LTEGIQMGRMKRRRDWNGREEKRHEWL